MPSKVVPPSHTAFSAGAGSLTYGLGQECLAISLSPLELEQGQPFGPGGH